jgi:hypothetical protein
MKTEKISGTMEKAYGSNLPTPIPYEGTFETYETVSEVRSANDMPNDEEVVTIRNQQRRNNARQKFMQAALDAAGVKKPTLDTSLELRVKNIVDSLVANGKSKEKALEIAFAALDLSSEQQAQFTA